MCGILAVFGDYRYKEIPEALLERGPDGHGMYVDDYCQLMQTRLKITGNMDLDLPLEWGNWVLLFNGEIYNYKELNEKYLYDFEFRYDSDFETILYGYSKFGKDFITFLDGQYAIIIYNKATNKHYVHTDQFKIRALYRIEYEGSIIYASNERSLPEMKFNKIPNMGYGNITNATIL